LDVSTTAALAWLMGDLRIREHAPLAEAAHIEHALGLERADGRNP
jgi:hypothetical protein